MKYDFDKLTDRTGTCSTKYDALDKLYGRSDLIPMWVADMDFEVAPFIVEAIRKRLDHRIYGYGMRSDAWYDSIVGWVERRNGWKIEPDWIDYSPGVITGYVFALRALTEEGDGVVINPPVYHPFASEIKSNGRKVIDSPVVAAGGRYELDFDDLDRKLAGAKALLFCNPHNPTGRVFTREELERVGELCVKHDVYIVSDEIHSDLVRKPHKHIHIASLRPEFAERSVTLISPSKTFNLAGLSTSVIITPDEKLRQRLRREAGRYDVGQGNVFGTVALQEAYTSGDEWLDQLNEYIEGNVGLVADFFESNIPEVKVYRNEGTYMVWLDCRALGMAPDELRAFFADKAGIAVNEGSMFGSEGAGFVRMVLAMPRSVVSRALEQIHSAYGKLGRNNDAG